MFQLITEPLCWLIGCAYLPYASFKAIQTPDGKDDKEFLVCWVVYSLVLTATTLPIFSSILPYFPFFYEIKLALLVWLIFLGGSSVAYNKLVAPFFKRHAKTVEELAGNLPGQLRTQFDRDGLEKFAAHVISKSAEIVQDHGVDAYRTVMAMLIQKEQQQHNEQSAAFEGSNVQSSVELGQSP